MLITVSMDPWITLVVLLNRTVGTRPMRMFAVSRKKLGQGRRRPAQPLEVLMRNAISSECGEDSSFSSVCVHADVTVEAGILGTD